MIVCTDAVSVATDTVAVQPLFSCGIVQNLPLPNTLKTEIHWPFQFRAKGQSHTPFSKREQMFQICESLVKSALYSWNFLPPSLISLLTF